MINVPCRKFAGFGSDALQQCYTSLKNEKVESKRRFYKLLADVETMLANKRAEAERLAKEALTPQILYSVGPFQPSLVRQEVVWQ